jgi:3-oxosteroid 1-dehydrogenase
VATKSIATYDWICVGTGVAGCSAAVAGADLGMRTLLIEKEPLIGGLTAESGGSVWIPMNDFMAKEGVRDDRDAALAHLRYISGGYAQEPYIESLVDEGNRALRYLMQRCGMGFSLVRVRGELRPMFFDKEAPGSIRGRLLIANAIEAKRLGDWRDRVRIPTFVSGLYEALGKVHPTKHTGIRCTGPARSSSQTLDVWRELLGDDKVASIMREEEKVRSSGAGLVASLFSQVRRRNVDVLTDAHADGVFMRRGRAAGLHLTYNGKSVLVEATKGILLATGGNPLFIDQNPGWRLGAEVGGAVETENQFIGLFELRVPGEHYPDGAPAGRINDEVELPHSIIVNRFGERFGDEYFFQAISPRTFDFEVYGEHRFRNVPCYLVFDSTFTDNFSFCGHPPGRGAPPWVTSSDSLVGLAKKLDIAPGGLAGTVATFNGYAREGKDGQFARRPDSLGELIKPPFHGVRLDTSDPFRAAIRLVADQDARVLHHRTGTPIDGLYASGTMVANGRLWGVGFQGGVAMTSYLVRSMLAAEHAAGKRL